MRKNNDEVSKKEQYRQERNARIEALRNADGSKKRLKQKSHKKRNRIIGIAVSAVLIIALLLYGSWLLGIPQRNLTAARVGKQTIKATEYNYSYYSTYHMYNQYFGRGGLLNLRADSSSVTGQNVTWGEFFRQNTEKTLQEQTVLYEKALEAGYKLEEEDTKKIDAYFTSMKAQVGTPLDFEVYLENYYGRGMNEKALRAVLEKQAIVARFVNDKPGTYEISDEQINKEYDENKDTYDIVSYYDYLLQTPSKDAEGKEKTADEIKEAKEKNEELAKVIVEAAKSPEDYVKELNQRLSLHDEEGENEIKASEYSNVNKNLSLVANEDVKTWLADPARKEGDSTYIATGNNFNILYFISREKDTRHPADAVVSYFSLKDQQDKKLSDDEIKKIKEEAERLKTTLKSEEDFKKYEEEEAKEGTPKAFDHQKYEKVDSRNVSNLPKEVLNYILSPDSKLNETAVIETENRVYLVMLTARYEDQDCVTIRIKDTLQAKAYQDDFNAWIEDPSNKFVPVKPGYWFAGK